MTGDEHEERAPARVVLGSASPRRRQLLAQIGIPCQVRCAAIDERPRAGEAAPDYVLRLAREKAAAVQRAWPDGLPVLAADTVVAVGDELLTKPADRATGLAMLEKLSGRMHEVHTGVVLHTPDGRTLWRLSTSRVWFRPLSPAEREAYWASGEPLGKAGGYAIQGLAAVFVRRLEGSYSGVMGLPLFETAELLRAVGIEWFREETRREHE